MRDQPASLAALTGTDLRAVADLWKRGGREIVARFGGTSMQPAIPPGVEVLLRCGEEAEVGSVIAFLDGGRLIVHRVVAVSPEQGLVLTCGDAHLVPDLPIADRGRIVGRVVGVRRDGEFVPVPAPPDGPARRLCAAALRHLLLPYGPRPLRAAIALVTCLRRWTVYFPWVLAARAKRCVGGEARRRSDPSRDRPEGPAS